MIFISKYLGLKKVIVPARYLQDNYGRRNYQAGKMVEFSDGRMETNDQETIDFLMNDSRYGIDFWALDQDGRAVVGNADKVLEEQKKEQEALDTTVHSCPTCPFKAQNRAGLSAHIRAKHPFNGPPA